MDKKWQKTGGFLPLSMVDIKAEVKILDDLNISAISGLT